MTGRMIALALITAFLVYGIAVGDFMETWRNGAAL